MHLLIWRHFRFEVPEDWEVLRFERDLAVGRLTLADRYQHRLEFSWRHASREPDLDRVVADYRARFDADEKIDEIESARSAGWPGLAACVDGELQTRFVQYFPDENCLLEAVFLWPERRDKELERQILYAVTPEAKDGQGLRRWKAFGMDMLVDDSLRLRECHVEAARARAVFGKEDDPTSEERFERVGMVPQWLKEPLETWLKRRVPKQVVVREQTVTTQADHEVHRIVGDWYQTPGMRLLRRGRPFEACAWICPVDGRLYSVTIWGAARPAGPRVAGERLACCDDLLEAPCS